MVTVPCGREMGPVPARPTWDAPCVRPVSPAPGLAPSPVRREGRRTLATDEPTAALVSRRGKTRLISADLAAIRFPAGRTDGACAVMVILSRPLAVAGFRAALEMFFAVSWSLWTTVSARE